MHLFPDRIRSRYQQLRHGWRELRWSAVSGRPTSFMMKVQPGIRMKLYGDSELCRLIYCRNFEAVERAFLNAFLQPGDIFVDVGANIGLFTIIAAARVGVAGKVISFEPTISTFKRLVENVQLNGFSNVECIQSALSDRAGDIELNKSVEGFDAWNSLAPLIKGNGSSAEVVQTIEWSRYALDHNLVGAVTMMKIDVEGWESRVMAGGKESLSRPDAPVLQVEFSDEAALSAGHTCQELYRYLEELGYKMFLYDPAQCRLVPDPIRERYPYLNLLAVKDAERVVARLQSSKQ